jgi:hypothetical protein
MKEQLPHGLTDNLHADQALRQAVALIEAGWPGRVRGYYLVGSYAVGEARPSSDLDLIVLLKGEIEPGDRERFVPLREACRRASALPLDITLESEARLFRIGGVWFQSASQLVYGEDVRAQIPRKPVENHVRDLMHAMHPLLARVRGNPAALRFPIGFPDPAGALRGYDARLRDDAPAHRAATKDLVTNVLAAANALTLLRARQYVGAGRKSDVPEQYRRWVGDEWAALVAATFERCRVQWDYQLPSEPAEREWLRELCTRVLAFENHFLGRYKEFLLAELVHANAQFQIMAARRMGQIVYDEPRVVAALRRAEAEGTAELRELASAGLRLMNLRSDAWN